MPDGSRPRRNDRARGLGLAVGGLAPLVTGLIGIGQYVRLGYVIPKTGGPVEGISGVLASALFVLAGSAMIGFGARIFRRAG